MELALNLAWFCIAVLMVWVYLRANLAMTGNRRLQLVALVLVIIILLPAISMTDDLLAAQNPAEIDISVRRCLDWPAPHAAFPLSLALFSPIFLTLPPSSFLPVPDRLANPFRPNPAIVSIENRPPPRS